MTPYVAQPIELATASMTSNRCAACVLRDAGYDFTVILPMLDELAAGRPEKAIVAVEKRREELTWTSRACIEALAFFNPLVALSPSQPAHAAPRSATLGLRMTCTGMRVTSSVNRPLRLKASINCPLFSNDKMRGGMPPPK